jgi:Ca-activated chloride channel family protein
MEVEMEENGSFISISDEDLETAQKRVQQPDLIIRETDLIGQTDTSSPGSKRGVQWSPPQHKGASKQPVDVILLIDTSGSMGANDYKPNRLQAAKDAAKLFTKRKVTQNYDDRVAVIGFGGRATVYRALNSDLDKVAASIDKLKITHSGTMIGRALQKAHRELKRCGGKQQGIVLLSDGGDRYDTSQPVAVARKLGSVKVFAIGIGTLKGGTAKLPHGRQKVYLNEKLLRQVAQATGGRYLYAPDVPQLQRVYSLLADYDFS